MSRFYSRSAIRNTRRELSCASPFSISLSFKKRARAERHRRAAESGLDIAPVSSPFFPFQSDSNGNESAIISDPRRRVARVWPHTDSNNTPENPTRLHSMQMYPRP